MFWSFYFFPAKYYMYIIGIKITVLGGTSLILVLFVNCHYLTWAASFLMHVAGKLDVSSKSSSLVRLRGGVRLCGG